VCTILDAGSRDALVADTLSSCYRDAIVYAFECNPPAIQMCLDVCRRNPRVRLTPKAVANVSAKVPFYAIDPNRTITPHADGNIGASSLFKANPDYPHEKYAQSPIEVEAIRLEDWLDGEPIEGVDILWMDLQGAELAALQGMGRWLSRTNVVYTEVSYKPVYIGSPLEAEVSDYLRTFGFVAVQTFNTNDWFGDVMYVASKIVAYSGQVRRPG